MSTKKPIGSLTYDSIAMVLDTCFNSEDGVMSVDVGNWYRDANGNKFVLFWDDALLMRFKERREFRGKIIVRKITDNVSNHEHR